MVADAVMDLNVQDGAWRVQVDEKMVRRCDVEGSKGSFAEILSFIPVGDWELEKFGGEC